MIDQEPRQRRTCDIVMKGGITSGVVYPQAITTLAKRYDFKNIGGTSAGAIAAAAAAAAQYRRSVLNCEEGFCQLGRLPELLAAKTTSGNHTRLFTLFQPNAGTRRIFQVATSALGGGGFASPLIELGKQYIGWTVMGALMGLSLGIWSALNLASGLIAVAWILVSLILFVVGGALGAVIGFVRDFIREVPKNGYGLCSGLSDPNLKRNCTCLTPITEWLTGYLNETAGRFANDDPLTFGQLWQSGAGAESNADRLINLEMMTTNLTHRRPFRLPFRDDDDLTENYLFYFRQDEFEKLFPKHIVDWMVNHPRDLKSIGNHRERDEALRAKLAKDGYLPLPAPADLPVVVATRMSLSFPVLLSAVPLHSIDRSTFYDNKQPERCWFSDGGMCSNFPIHFFDGVLPRRPTFSIDLTEKSDCTLKEMLVPEMDNTNISLIENWYRFDTEVPTSANQVPREKSAANQVFGFADSIIRTMQNWTDTTQGRLPGFRDRIVRVPLTPSEGGLNLDMPRERIIALTDRGVAAAKLLIQHFDVPAGHEKMTWDNHRWIRLRSFLASLETSLRQLALACDHPENGDVSYKAWLDRLLIDKTGKYRDLSYAPTKEQILAAIETLKQLHAVSQLWENAGTAAKKSPRPRPVLRPRPQI